MNKMMVIGLDGMEPNLIEKWRDNLPNLDNLISEGVYSRLKSTTPLGSGPSWTSFSTGKNPWNHGVYALWHRHADGRPYKSKDIESARLWDYLNEEGYKTGIVNIPVTYPPEKLKGFMISSLLTPSDSENFSYPPELKERLPNYRPEFETVDTYDKEGVKKALNSIHKTTKERKENIVYLMENEDWDFFAFNLRGTDQIAHKCWHLIDEEHPLHTPELQKKFGNAYLEYYQFIDKIVGDLVERLPNQSDVFIVSDHGTGRSAPYKTGSNFLYTSGKKSELAKLFIWSDWSKRKHMLSKGWDKVKTLFKSSHKKHKNKRECPPGGHRFYGIFIGNGPDIKENREIEGAKIIDLAPTILHLFGLPVAKDMDGQVLTKIFKDNSEPADKEIKYRKPGKFEKEYVEEKTMKEDEEEIRERLKDLGYL